MNTRPRSGGFTLVELVAAVVITALVAGTTVTIVRGTAFARRVASDRLGTRREAIAATDAIASAVSNAWGASSDRTRLVGIDDTAGDVPADTLRLFVATDATVREGAPESDVMAVEFRLAGGEAGRPPALWKRIDPTLNEEPDEGGVAYIVAENVISLDIHYHDGVEWRDDWPESAGEPPMAVRIRTAAVDPELGAGAAPIVWTAERIVRTHQQTAEQTPEQTTADASARKGT
jgi:type II secretory pathway pseudopilin PulG